MRVEPSFMWCQTDGGSIPRASASSVGQTPPSIGPEAVLSDEGYEHDPLDASHLHLVAPPPHHGEHLLIAAADRDHQLAAIGQLTDERLGRSEERRVGKEGRSRW